MRAGVAGDGTEKQRQGRVDGVTGSAGIGPDTLADLVHRLAAELLLKQLKERH